MSTIWYKGCRSTRCGGSWTYARIKGSPVVANEIREYVDRGHTDDECRLRKGEISDLLDRAAIGECEWKTDVLEVATSRDLLELRFDEAEPIGSEEPPVVFRLYFAEPRQYVSMILALHFHRKSVDGTRDEIKDAQNAAINEADARYGVGAEDGWGSGVSW